jgi:hypothetical protein
MVRIENLGKMRFKITGKQLTLKGDVNKAVLVIVYMISQDSSRTLNEVIRTITNNLGEYTFDRTWLPGDYVIKFFGNGISPNYEYFTIPQEGIYDITPPKNSHIYKISS